MQRVALINWKNINQDSDLSKIFESFSKPGVVNWLKVVSWWVEAGFAFVPVIREWKSFVVLFELTERLSFDTSGTKKIFIEILEEKIIDWSWNAVDWTWIWHIRVSASYPNKNFLPLARVENGNIIDERIYVSVRYFLEGFNTAWKLVQLESNGRIKESLLPPMNININWLPTQTLDWNSYIVANSSPISIGFNTNSSAFNKGCMYSFILEYRIIRSIIVTSYVLYFNILRASTSSTSSSWDSI